MNLYDDIGRELRRKVLFLYQQGFTYADHGQRNKAQTAVRLSLADAIPDDFTRRRIMSFLFRGTLTDLSTRDLTDCELEGMKKWLAILPAPGNTWTISMKAAQEIKTLVTMLNGENRQIAIPLQPEQQNDMVETVVGWVSREIWDEHAKRLAEDNDQSEPQGDEQDGSFQSMSHDPADGGYFDFEP